LSPHRCCEHTVSNAPSTLQIEVLPMPASPNAYTLSVNTESQSETLVHYRSLLSANSLSSNKHYPTYCTSVPGSTLCRSFETAKKFWHSTYKYQSSTTSVRQTLDEASTLDAVESITFSPEH
jgi:hypothetical protein